MVLTMIMSLLEFTFQSVWHFFGMWILIGTIGAVLIAPFRAFGVALSKPGPEGPQGFPGPCGMTGQDGRDGKNGKDCVCNTKH